MALLLAACALEWKPTNKDAGPDAGEGGTSKGEPNGCSSGDGADDCSDKCSSAGCDPNATCDIVGTEAVCTCLSDYVGDGKTCDFDASCSLLDCDDAKASCEVTADNTRECRCRAGYRGSGITCTNIDECAQTPDICGGNSTCHDTDGSFACDCIDGYEDMGSGCQNVDDCTPNPCRNGGRCTDGVNDYTCDCSNTGFAGARCQTDPCTPDPCRVGLTCVQTTSGTANCLATCASSELGCQPGDVCTSDADCRTGHFNGASCDPASKVCVWTCPSTSIISQSHLAQAQYCREIDGNLVIEPDFANLGADALPYLTRVRGNLNAGSASGNRTAESITVGNLQTVDGLVQFGGFLNLARLSFPRLTSIGSFDLILTSAALQQISLPQLTTVEGNFRLSYLQGLSQLEIRRLVTVGGTLSLNNLCKLPWSQIEAISMLGTSQSVTNIGCCTMFDRHACDVGPCTCN
jgi:hypothetical protein